MKSKFAAITNAIREFLILHPGKITVPIFCLLLRLGWLGTIFGFIVGWLIDELIRQMRLKRQIRRYLAPGKWNTGAFRLPASVLVLAHGLILSENDSPENLESQFAVVKTELPKWSVWNEAEKRQIEPILDILSGGVDTGDLKRHCGVIVDSKRIDNRDLMHNLAALARRMGINPAQNRFLARTADTLGIPHDDAEKWFRESAVDNEEKKEQLQEAYRILGVSDDVDQSELKRIYRSLAAQFHPDGGVELTRRQQAESQEAFVRVREAYERVIRARSAHPDS